MSEKVLKGIIIKGIGGFYYIEADGDIYECKARGAFRKKKISPLAGDNVINSQDSRYWGLLPEQFIHGVAVRIGKSADPYDGRIRWRRVLRKINL